MSTSSPRIRTRIVDAQVSVGCESTFCEVASTIGEYRDTLSPTLPASWFWIFGGIG